MLKFKVHIDLQLFGLWEAVRPAGSHPPHCCGVKVLTPAPTVPPHGYVATFLMFLRTKADVPICKNSFQGGILQEFFSCFTKTI